ncbi:conserved exported hypothetical protein [Candidatus Terasakiella magnetica]|uniref:Cytochrome c domain-containing protein n=1 Tax=Candidatus Terasakiella magnetica TaxID=1867952 RepID=A0A1C3RK16_9PROT|nr:di-heme oxidoredictase family protein [Candidatus Terasakiella magnetica]SCA57589.1 conserved exported hypothetical protein [Candidatus Terasakiella magnetica]
MKKTTFVLCGLLLGTSSAQAASLDFAMGKALFDRPWTSAPASTQATDGLGPLFNARSCVACHPKGGRGKITVSNDGKIGGLGYVLRLGNEKGEADPIYGRQLQTNAIHGQKAEARVYLDDNYYRIEDLAYGEMSPETNYAGRLSQPLFGLGLLEDVSDETILAQADPEDKNNDGISGRPNMINGQLGRFAWKATAPTLRIQAANAFSNDIGMSTPIHRHHFGDCTAKQPECQKGPHGDSVQFENLEIDSKMLNLVALYLKRLKAPTPQVQETLPLFKDVGCASCHTPELTTKSGKKVAAYSDLLLHDMGDGLADGIAEGQASGREWRTQPLWGTSNTKRFLHDGRATSVEEAINWHGGEAQRAKENFLKLSASDKHRLISFLNSL